MSQVVPVVQVVNGVKKLKRLAINYKNTVNDHLVDTPNVSTTCSEDLNKFCSCVDLRGAFKQIVINDDF